MAQKYVDPQQCLPTDVIAPAAYIKLHRFILQRRSWPDFQLCFSVSDATFIRFSSVEKLTLADINCDVAHGPTGQRLTQAPVQGMTPELAMAMIGYVPQPGDKHKDRHKYQKVAGAWRHQDWLRCPTGAVAMSLLVRFHNNPDEIHFYAGRQGQKPMWMKRKLLTYWTQAKNYKSTYNAAVADYDAMYTSCNVQWAKKTHLRMSGMDKCGSQGIDTDAIISMSTHSTTNDKKLRYVPQLNSDVMLVMAGFQKHETYHVPRTFLDFPFKPGGDDAVRYTLDEVIRILFPMYDVWLSQHTDAAGDKSNAANNFLFKTIPFQSLVIVQDGVFLTCSQEQVWLL